jgi:hypothetical protein
MQHKYLGFIARSLYMFRVLLRTHHQGTIKCSLLPLVQHMFRCVVTVVVKIRQNVSMIGRLVTSLWLSEVTSPPIMDTF